MHLFLLSFKLIHKRECYVVFYDPVGTAGQRAKKKRDALLCTFLQFLSVHFNLNRILPPCFSSQYNNISLQRL